MNDFYPTSPAIQDISTALVYPGMGLLEGINVNEGRGTEKPFLKFGAPWINPEELITKIDQSTAEIILRPVSYTPGDSLYKNEKCHGVELELVDKNRFRPVSFGIDLISILVKLYPQHIQERAYVTHANPSGAGHLDKLLGIKNAFDILRSNASVATNVSQSWSQMIKDHLLYN